MFWPSCGCASWTISWPGCSSSRQDRAAIRSRPCAYRGAHGLLPTNQAAGACWWMPRARLSPWRKASMCTGSHPWLACRRRRHRPVTPQKQRWEWYRAAKHRVTCTAGTPNSTVTTGAGINRRDMAVVWPHHDKHYYVAYHEATTCYELQQCNNVNQSAWQNPNMKTKPHCNLVCGSDMRNPK